MRQNNDGYVVLITVLVLGAVTTVIVGFLLLTGQNASIASNGVVANANAKASANACAQLALGAISANSTSPSPLSLNQVVNATSGQACTYLITGASPNYGIAATGTVTQGPKTYTHRLSLTTNQVIPQIKVSSWQDSP